MNFLSDQGDYQQLGEAWQRYTDYLKSIKRLLPAGAYGFATAPWHYDPADHRSLHDSWVEEVKVKEEAPGMSQTPRRLRIDVRLIGPYHDGYHQFAYSGVSAYRLTMPDGTAGPVLPSGVQEGHGDWLIDEIRLAPGGSLVHEVVFSTGARWVIECESMEHSTTIPPLRG
jgi:hypothetical protein